MSKQIVAIAALTAGILGTISFAQAQQAAPMSFFLSSAGSGKGADLGGLEGADRICQSLAAAAGSGNFTWRAYLSTSSFNNGTIVNARDRIGNGP